MSQLHTSLPLGLPDGSVPLLEWPGYFISRNGEVFSVWPRGVQKGFRSTARKLSQSYAGRNYPKVSLVRCGDEHPTTMFVHSLVALAFFGPRPAGREVRHLNGNKDDNSVGNLTWGTKAENALDSIRLGSTTKGNKNAMAKLNPDSVREIRAMVVKGIPQSQIARKFNVSQSNVSFISRSNTWAHVA